MKLLRKLVTEFEQPFQLGDRLDIGLVLAFLLINVIVFYNASFHDPRIGYDADAHTSYIQTLSHLRLVTPQDSHEFFSPPLPYIFPALFISLTGMKVFWALKLAQYLNFVLSVGLTLYLIKTCQIISSQSSLKLGALVFLGILPVYYKTFAFVRGEPYVVFFTVVMMYYALQMSVKKRFSVSKATILGGAMGLCALSRQWGILLFPSVFLFLIFQWFRLPELRYSITRTLCLCLILILLISGWFYLSLYFKYGSITAFNRKPNDQFAFSNQPLDFYIGLNHRLLFENPVRPNFPNQFLPILYSELWGDYWCYFTVGGRDIRNPRFRSGPLLSRSSRPLWLETNYDKIGAYLGRVNLVSIFPTFLSLVSLFIAAAGIFKKDTNDPLTVLRREIYSFFLLAIGTTIAGYFWFLITYPNIGKGDTIKATYILQVFPFIAILVAILLEHVKRRSQFFNRLILGGLFFSFVHNFLVMLTHYQLWKFL